MNQMMCDECGENIANVHLTQITNDQSFVSHLCEKCAHKHGISISAAHAENAGLQVSKNKADERECPECHLKFGDFKKRGRLGCIRCYEIFVKEIDELLVQVHGATSHCGKRYSGLHPQEKGSQRVESLRHALHDAVENEQFELAASLRDKIRSISVHNHGAGDCVSS